MKFSFPLAEHQKIRYNQNMSTNLDWIVKIEKETGMELMPENPCGTGFHGVGGGGGQLLKAQQKRFTQMNKKTQVSELVLKCIKSNKST